jgi:kinesin family protein C2/C3
LAEVEKVLGECADVDFTNLDALKEAKLALSDSITAAKAGKVAEASLLPAELRRRKIHNGIEDIKGSIRVFCRVRPLSSKETMNGDTNAVKQLDTMNLSLAQHFATINYGFDAVFTPGTQDEVFEDCCDLVQSAVDGFNVTMFAYGQTGAGKTYTMYGYPGQEGAAPRTITELFRIIDRDKERFNYTVMASMLELYRNDLVDLLTPAAKQQHDPNYQKAAKLNIRAEKSGMVMVDNLIEEACGNAAELSVLLDRGNEMRHVASTAMNSESSRSHLILIIKIVSVNKETHDQLRGKILLVDLAGSERLKKSEAQGDMAKEAIEINKSLTALGDVIEALTKKQKQIPYRNHKLTQIMQDSLGGSSKTLMFVNCSPASSNVDETTMSLKYATRAKNVTNKTVRSSMAQAKPMEIKPSS